MEPSKFKNRDFVHLHLHSDYSLLHSTIQLKALAKRLASVDMKACALTDTGNMFGAVSFYLAMKGAGLQPIVGYEAIVTPGSRFDRSTTVAPGERPYYGLVLLAKSFEGYQNLVFLASKAYTEGLHHKARVDHELLNQYSADLFALSGGAAGAIWHYLKTGNQERAKEYAREMNGIFGPGNFFIEIEDHGIPEDQVVMRESIKLARELDIPIVATNGVYYLDRDDSKAQEILMCLSDGRTLNDPSHPSLPNDSYYLRSAEEMWSIFGDEFPDALENTVKIAEQCHLEIPTGILILPNFPIPPDSGCETLDQYFEKIVHEGLAEKKRSVLGPMSEEKLLKYSFEKYDERLALEIEIIERMGYSGYFLVVWEFIHYAKQKGIPVGPGRGSAAGSLVAYCMGITDVDPLQYELFFERFLNPERISMPDIDIDFCIRGRGDVIDHVTEFYGRDSVCQIITFATMASKAAIKDVGRAMNMPIGEVERIAKLIPPPFRGRITSISDALVKEPELGAAMTADPKVRELIDLALRVEGCSRHTSVHAAGVVIAPRPLHEIVPIALSPKNELTSQYPMGDLEKVGLLKMDFLGLTTLTIIDDCLRTLKEKTGIAVDWSRVSLKDEATMALFGEGKTEAVFQFESSGMQEICRRLKPKELEDLAALNALYRPGPLDGGMVEEFIARHRGEKKVEYLIPEMVDILRNTYGVLVYQEQIMQLAQKLAGYSLGEADLMRRAMGKKKPEEMAPHEVKFMTGAVERGIAKKTAKEVFDLMAKFADYGFNRSHSIAYAMLAFQTAYLKAHYPTYFYAAVLSHEADDSAKVYKYSNELRSMGLDLLPPDVNESDEGFTPGENSVRFGLSAIKGMGAAAAHAIIAARRAGKFSSLFDFVSRLDQGAINRRSLESLITAGAFDSMMPELTLPNDWRARLFGAIEPALAYGQSAWNDKIRGQGGLFAADSESAVEPELPLASPWTQSELAANEKAAIGFYLCVHPLDEYREIVKGLKIPNIADHPDLRPGQQIVVAGIVSALQVRWSKKGNRFAQFRIEDRSAGVKCLMWSEAYTKHSLALENDALLIVEGKVESVDGGETTLIVNEVRSLVDAVSKSARAVSITFPQKDLDENFLQDIYSVLNESHGRCEVLMKMSVGDISVSLKSSPIRVEGSQRLERELSARGCAVEWVL